MSITTIRQKLHNYLEIADDKKIRAIYTMMESEIEETAVKYSDQLKQELDSRYVDFKEETEKMVSAEESRKRIRKKLRAMSGDEI